MADLDITRLRRLLAYDPSSGHLTWRVARGAVRAGAIAGSIGRNGYRYVGVRIDGKKRTLIAHRVIWAIAHGRWPVGEIDHVNHNRSDNRLANLRDVTRGQNIAHSRARTDLGLKGAYLTKNGRYHCVINQNKRTHYIGKFKTAEEAHAAYMAEAKRRFGEFAYGIR